MKHFVTLNQKWEQDQYTPKAPSTVMQNGGFLMFDGLGGVIPATAGLPIMGLGQEDVLASDVDYTSARQVAYQEVGPNIFFTIDVTAGTALSNMVGQVFNLDTPETLSVIYPTLVYNTLAGGPFVVGETVRVTSADGLNSTAVVVTDNGSTSMTIKSVHVLGTGFSNVGATLLGLTSGATAVVGTAPVLGTQIEVTAFISATQVEGKVVLTA